MIKSDFGMVAVNGEKPIILAELTTLLSVLRDGGVSDAEIDRCVERAKKPKEELATESKKRMEDAIKSMLGGSDDKPKKSGKAVVVSVDADTPAEDVAKQISEVVAKTVREMLDKKDEE
jgi:hypothetical protein